MLEVKEEILFCKYSNERDNKFKIRTDIIRKEDGSKIVNKTALTREAKNHIIKLFENYKLLDELFADSKIYINKCIKNNNVASFEFIEGVTLEEELDKLLCKKDYIGIINKIQEYANILRRKMGKYRFSICDEFESVFGNIHIKSSLECCDINDIDLNFNNILVVKDSWHIIDYEWTFNFPIPLNFIIYRAIFWYIQNAEKRSELKKLDLYKIVGISDEEIEEYKKMEINFQKYVLGDWKQLDSLYGKTTLKNIDIKEVIDKENLQNYRESIQVFYDYGNGFSEDNSYKINNFIKNDKTIEFEVLISESVKSVRIDPSSWYSLLRIDKIFGMSEILYPINYTTNGIAFAKDMVLFGSNDPQIIISDISPNTYKLEVAFEIEILSQKEFITINNYINENMRKLGLLKDELESQLQLKEQLENQLKIKVEKQLQIQTKMQLKNDALNSQLEKVNKQYNDMQIRLNDADEQIIQLQNSYNIIINSACWKVTKPIRILFDLIKKILRKENFKLIGENLNNTNIVDNRNIIDNNNMVKYSIDKFEYKNDVLCMAGWIFDESKKIENISIIFNNSEINYELNDISLFERKDVFEVYKNDNALLSGFDLKILIKNNEELSVYIKIDSKEVFINKIESNLDNAKNDLVIQQIFDGKQAIDLVKYQKNNTVDRLLIPNEIYNNTIDIIIPIYNGYEYLSRLFETIKKTKMKYRLIIINDNSPDKRINKFLEQFPKDLNVNIIHNDENLGFVKSVNRGLKIAKNNIALLNTDIELPEMWLERLMLPILCEENVGSSTPFTNSGTICSFPEFCKDNLIFENLTVDAIDSAFKTIIPRYEEMPTGVGFCMGMNKKALDEIGYLDDETFIKGYGEENDWCQRAIKHGYKNVHIENLFVYHKHGGSFLSEEKKRLIKRNSNMLSQKHSNYNVDVAKYCSLDPNKDIRDYIKFILLSKNINTILYFNHNLGGGASKYLENKIERNILDGKAIVQISYDVVRDFYYLEYKYLSYEFMYYFVNIELLFKFLNTIKLTRIYINELVTYPQLDFVLQKILELKDGEDIELVMLMHDLYCICPTVNLLNNEGKYCNIPTVDKCRECLSNCKFSLYPNCCDIEEWRKMWNNFLIKCNNVICFSENTRLLLEKAYSLQNNIVVKPHEMAPIPPLNKKYKHTEALNIGLLGILSYHKGIEVIKSLIKVIEEKNININIILIGKSEEKIDSTHFKETGEYDVYMIPKLILEYDIDVFFIASICPETFSYTTQEIIELNMPVVSFNIGAQGEKVKKFEKGAVLDNYEPDYILDKIIEHSKKFNYNIILGKKVLFVGEYISFSSRYRVDHLREKMLFYGIQSDFIMIDEIKNCNLEEYKTVVIYRCRNNSIISDFIDRCHKKNKNVYYDIDDYIFNYNDIKYMKFLQSDEYENFKEYTQEIYECMSKCDAFITSTINMKKAIQESFNDKPVCINRNAVSLEMLLISLKAKCERIVSEDKITIGYFSGSNTHNDDFKLIEEALIEALENNDKVNLKIGGCLKLPKKFEAFIDRIEYVEFVDWKLLPKLIASVDINLLPLEDNFFTSCKSENKWTEAALVAVPTIMSFNTEFEKVVKNGKNALLCKDKQEWKYSLEKLINDKSYRLEIAMNAHKYVIQNYVTINSDNSVIDFVLK